MQRILARNAPSCIFYTSNVVDIFFFPDDKTVKLKAL